MRPDDPLRHLGMSGSPQERTFGQYRVYEYTPPRSRRGRLHRVRQGHAHCSHATTWKRQARRAPL